MLCIIAGSNLSELSRMTNEWDNRNAYQSFIVLSINVFHFSPWSPTIAPYLIWILMFNSEIIILKRSFLHLILLENSHRKIMEYKI